MKIPRSKHFTPFVQSEISFLGDILESLKSGKAGRLELVIQIQDRIIDIGRFVGPKSKSKCIEKCDFQPISGLHYKRKKDGQLVQRLRCTTCGLTKTKNKLSPAQLHPYQETVCIILLLEGIRVSDIKKMFPMGGLDFYYWRDKCMAKPIHTFMTLKANGVEEGVENNSENPDEEAHDFSFEDFPSTDSEMHLRLNAKSNAGLIEDSHLKQIRITQLLLLGLTFDEIRETLNLDKKIDINYFLERKLKDFKPLPPLRMTSTPDNKKKRPVYHRSWDKRCTFVFKLGSRDTTTKSLLIYGEFTKRK